MKPGGKGELSLNLGNVILMAERNSVITGEGRLHFLNIHKKRGLVCAQPIKDKEGSTFLTNISGFIFDFFFLLGF
jgi:hypothetical protein